MCTKGPIIGGSFIFLRGRHFRFIWIGGGWWRWAICGDFIGAGRRGGSGMIWRSLPAIWFVF